MTFLAASNNVKNVDISGADATLVAVLGYAVVFVGLIALLLVVAAIGLYFTRKAKAAKEAPDAPEAVQTPDAPLAPGSAGQLKLHNVEPKTAAMLMAIVADKLGKPLNELRFISIKEVE